MEDELDESEFGLIINGWERGVPVRLDVDEDFELVVVAGETGVNVCCCCCCCFVDALLFCFVFVGGAAALLFVATSANDHIFGFGKLCLILELLEFELFRLGLLFELAWLEEDVDLF